jgi:hypothetical protein
LQFAKKFRFSLNHIRAHHDLVVSDGILPFRTRQQENIMMIARKKMLCSVASVAAAMAAWSSTAMAQNIIGPTKIISVTSTIPSGSTTYTLPKIHDGITSDITPFNGFEGENYPYATIPTPIAVPSATSTLTFTLDQPYSLTKFHLWNDINVRAESVATFKLVFFDAGGVAATSPIYNTASGTVPVQDFALPAGLTNITKVEMQIVTVFNSAATFARRVEIREVAFSGAATPPPISMPGDHFQCYRVVEGPALKPEKLTVSDQFGKATIVLARPIMLCNPSIKVHNGKEYGVTEPKRHLVCYLPIEQSDQQQTRKVKINNQMAPANLTLRERQMFCVPSSKQRLDAPDLPMEVSKD